MKAKMFFLGITISLLTLLTLSVAKADPLGTLGLKIKIKTHAAYLNEVAKAKELGHTFWCESIAEELKTKDYSSSSVGPSVYSLVVLNCRYSPHDGLDSYRVIGLATMDGDQVLNFTVANVNQPD